VITIVAGVVTFTLVVVALVLVLVGAQQKLVGSGEVTIGINGDPGRELRVTAGRTLLATLASEDVFLPSACGGQGTCGACTVVVRAGGGELLPTETAHINPREARQGLRLSCQLRVKNDMEIDLPESIFGIRKWRCRVRSNRNVATFIKEVVLELPEGVEMPFEAGGYVQLHVPPYEARFADFDIPERFRGDWERAGLFRLVARVRRGEDVQRAYSLASHPGERGILMLDVRIATPPPDRPGAPPGKGSSYVFSLRPGDEVVVSGPYGELLAKASDREMVFIGGGAGMAPLRSIVFDQLERVKTARPITYWYGARSRREAFYVDDFERLAREHDNFGWHLALSEPLPDDDWEGSTGFIHDVVYREHLERHPAPEDVEYYLCGPPPMLKACLAMLDDLGVEPDRIAFDEF
jgi:Na+-transporting NADH:ubiquinone oxidoreductase subunit F